MMYPEDFIMWITHNHYYHILDRGWYVWPDDEKDEVFICTLTSQLFDIFKNQK